MKPYLENFVVYLAKVLRKSLKTNKPYDLELLNALNLWLKRQEIKKTNLP